MDLLVVGDANADLVLRGGDIVPRFGQREQLVDHAELVLGGSGAILAAGAAKLGLDVAMVACVGDDPLGRLIRDELATAGVDVGAVRAVDAATGVSVGLVREDDRSMLTATGALAHLRAEDVPDEMLERARHVHVASPFLQDGLAPGLRALAGRVGGTTSRSVRPLLASSVAVVVPAMPTMRRSISTKLPDSGRSDQRVSAVT